MSPAQLPLYYVRPADDYALLQGVLGHKWEECCRLIVPRTDANDTVTSTMLLDELMDFVDEQDFYKGSLLHCMILSDAPLDAIDRVISLLRDQNILSVRDSEGETPLHYACCYGSVEVVKRLLELDPSQARATNGTGQLPLHRAVPHRRSPEGVVAPLLEAWPEAAQTETDAPDGEERATPLSVFARVWRGELGRRRHVGYAGMRPYRPVDGWADGRRIARDTLGHLARAHRHGRVVPAKDRTTLHDALSIDDESLPHADALRVFLVATSPRADMSARDDRGDFPLHAACRLSPPSKRRRRLRHE